MEHVRYMIVSGDFARSLRFLAYKVDAGEVHFEIDVEEGLPGNEANVMICATISETLLRQAFPTAEATSAEPFE